MTRAPRAHAVRIAKPRVPPHVLGPDLTPRDLGDAAPVSTAAWSASPTPPPMPAPRRGRFLAPDEIRERISYLRRWAAAPATWANRRKMRAEWRALREEVVLAKWASQMGDRSLSAMRRNRTWVEDETRQTERDLMAAMSVGLPRGTRESRAEWDARRAKMLAAWREEPTDGSTP